MRSIFILTFLTATLLILTTGCIKYSVPIPKPPASTPPSGTPPSNTNSPGGTFSATIADSAWTADYYRAIFYQGRQMFEMTGVKNPGNGDSAKLVFYFYVPFQLNQPISTDTADIAYYNDSFTFAWDAGNNYRGSAYINVTAYDPANHTIAGGFYGTLANDTSGATAGSVIVKDGTFNLNYTLQP